jgi:hypothetical protein
LQYNTNSVGARPGMDGCFYLAPVSTTSRHCLADELRLATSTIELRSAEPSVPWRLYWVKIASCAANRLQGGPAIKVVWSIDPRQRGVRTALRTIGPLLIIVGGVLTGTGVISFFSAFGTFETPRYFWCAVLGMPVLALGMAISKFAYLGPFFRYVVGETAPVQKDTFNYMAEGTSKGMRTLAEAVGQGFAAGVSGTHQEVEGSLSCVNCQAPNPASHQFCCQCGTALTRTRCDACGNPNGPEASFCAQCGAALL